jgi:hypothetical protein
LRDFFPAFLDFFPAFLDFFPAFRDLRDVRFPFPTIEGKDRRTGVALSGMKEPSEGGGGDEREAETGVPRVNIRRGGVSNAGEAGEAAEAGSEAEAEEGRGEAAGKAIFGKRSISASPVSGFSRHTTFTFFVRA